MKVDANTPCIWIVYPPGCSGDLVASIVNRHYTDTGSSYHGIKANGQVHFISSDDKLINIRHKKSLPLLTDEMYDDVSNSLNNRNLNITDPLLFSNHLCSVLWIRRILNSMQNSKIIRILPADVIEERLAFVMGKYKNFDSMYTFDSFVRSCDIMQMTHDRLLTVPFGSLFSKPSFDASYQRIMKFLSLQTAIVQYDYIEDYISRQHPDFIEKLQQIGLKYAEIR